MSLAACGLIGIFVWLCATGYLEMHSRRMKDELRKWREAEDAEDAAYKDYTL